VTREILQFYTGSQNEVVDELLILLRKLAVETARESARLKAVEMVGRSRNVPLLSDNSGQKTHPVIDSDEGFSEVFADYLAQEMDTDQPVAEAA